MQEELVSEVGNEIPDCWSLIKDSELLNITILNESSNRETRKVLN